MYFLFLRVVGIKIQVKHFENIVWSAAGGGLQNLGLFSSLNSFVNSAAVNCLSSWE